MAISCTFSQPLRRTCGVTHRGMRTGEFVHGRVGGGVSYPRLQGRLGERSAAGQQPGPECLAPLVEPSGRLLELGQEVGQLAAGDLTFG